MSIPLSHSRKAIIQVAGIAGAAALSIGVAASMLPPELSRHGLALVFGAPVLLICFVGRRGHELALVCVLAFAPLAGIARAITGSRLAPLVFDLTVFVLVAIGIYHHVLAHRRLDYLDAALLILLALALLQLANPNVPGLSVGAEGFRKFAFMSIVFYAGRYMLSIRGLRTLARIACVMSVPLAGYGLKQFWAPSPLDWQLIEMASGSVVTYRMGGQIRPFVTFPGPFHYGLFLVVVISYLIYTLICTRLHGLQKLLSWSLVGLNCILLLLTRTKANWFGLMVSVAILIGLSPLARRKWAAILPVILVVVSIGAAFLFLSGTRAAVLEEAIQAATNPLHAPTFRIRLDLWQATILPAISAHPLRGYGTGSAGEGMSHLFRGTGSQWFGSHNLYLKILIELGMPGLALFGLLVWGALQRGKKQIRWLRRQCRYRSEVLVVWAMAVCIAFLVTGLAGAMLDAYPVNYYFWLLLGFVCRPTWKALDGHTSRTLPRLEEGRA